MSDTNQGTRYLVIPPRQTREQIVAYLRYRVEMAALQAWADTAEEKYKFIAEIRISANYW